MQQDFNDITVLFPSKFDLEEIKQLKAMYPFDEDVTGFLNALSQELTKDLRTRAFPDVATFAFFCRKSNILQLREKYTSQNEFRLGRGIVFHVAPSNVPVNFAYSLLCGILSGNVNIVRVSSKEFQQVSVICEAIAKIAKIEIYKNVTQRIYLVQYDRQSTATALFSSVCDVRVIWGGDETIAEIRKNLLPARSFDVTFADRYSLCIINANVYCDETHPEVIASGFYNDTYLLDQNACTAPHLLIWMGKIENVKKSKEIFWKFLYQTVKEKYNGIQPIIAVDKLTTLYNQAMCMSEVHKTASEDNLLWRIQIDSLPENIDKFRCSSGYFTEYHIQSLSELTKVINRKYQTLAYYGFSKEYLCDFMKETHPSGIDRIVPIGHTTDFSLIWDGYDLIKVLSRSCEIL
ncbi:MAG: acyl-CoA reductase [Prevotellaceae bacterium]|jgi:hypothetical protein|nr:acyl-CoA reductase [Prevotellaceae bacterium]